MSKINTKNLICCRVENKTRDNITKAINALESIENDEFYYNYELSDFAHETRLTVVEILKECYKEQNKFKSIFDE